MDYLFGTDVLGASTPSPPENLYLACARQAVRSKEMDDLDDALEEILGVDVGYDVGEWTRIVNGMKPMTVEQAHTVTQAGLAMLHAMELGSDGLTTKQADAKQNFDKLESGGLEALRMDPLTEQWAGPLRTTFLQVLVDFNAVIDKGQRQVAAIKQIPHDVAQAAHDALQSAKDAAGAVAWYAKATYWVAIGAGVLALAGITIGVAYGLKARIAGGHK